MNDRTQARSGGGRRWPALGLVGLVAMVVVAAVVLRDDGGGTPRGAATDGEVSGFNPSLETGLVIGDAARLPEGGVARVNGVRLDAPLAAGLPAPEPGMTLVRLDVELCAGAAGLFVDAAFWVGLGDDGGAHSAHLGVRDLVTLTLAPGSCQRGAVDLAVPEGVDLQGVLLIDTTESTVARWTAGGQGERQSGELPPLRSEVEAEAIPVGSPADLVTGGTATLHAVAIEGTAAVLDGEVCAGDAEILTGPRYWHVQLGDHRIVPARRDGAAEAAATLAPATCTRMSVEFTVPAGAPIAAALYATDGLFEDARWSVE